MTVFPSNHWFYMFFLFLSALGYGTGVGQVNQKVCLHAASSSSIYGGSVLCPGRSRCLIFFYVNVFNDYICIVQVLIGRVDDGALAAEHD